MTIETLLVGGAAALIGTAFCVAGYPLFLILLPAWAFLYGLLGLGGSAAAAMGGGFLATTVALGIGVIFGAFMAVLALSFWWAGVVLFGATIGYLLSTGLLGWIGIEPGLISVFVGLAVAAVFGVVFVIYRMPRVVVVVITAIAGAATAVAGILVVFNVVSIETLKAGPLEAIHAQGPLSILGAVALAIAGLFVQLVVAKGTEVEIWHSAMGDKA